MKEFPKIDDHQVVLITADRNTGHILDVNGKLKQSDEQEVYTTFNSLAEANSYAREKILNNKEIECVIYNAKDEVIAQISIEKLPHLYFY